MIVRLEGVVGVNLIIIVFTNVCDRERKIRQNVAFVALLNEYLPHVADSTE